MIVFRGQALIPTINLHPAYAALILKKFNGICLKEVEGRSRNLSTKGGWVLIRCNMHDVKLCACQGCPARSLDKCSNEVLSLTSPSLKMFCTTCSTHIRQYQQTWKDQSQQIAEIVQTFRHNITAAQALQHITVPDHWLGRIVGMVKLAPGVATVDLPLDVLRAQTLATPEFLTNFGFTHSLQSAMEFERTVTFHNTQKPGLWKAEVDLQDLPLECLPPSDRSEIMQYLQPYHLFH